MTFVIPSDRLPPGFADGIEQPPIEPAAPRPSATAVLLRDTAAGPEVLLLRRNRTVGFVPGAYVFPGGRVDPADAEPALLERLEYLPSAPPARFWAAAVREVFEETGVLLAADGQGGAVHAPEVLSHWRDALLADRTTLLQLLNATGLHVDLAGVVHAAHWITPVAEPRRYDTHFFLAALPAGALAAADAREMSDAVWLAPAAALERFAAGRLPMVFPTVRTLEALVAFATVDAALAHFRGRDVLTVLPRLIRTAGGVGIVVDDEDSNVRG